MSDALIPSGGSGARRAGSDRRDGAQIGIEPGDRVTGSIFGKPLSRRTGRLGLLGAGKQVSNAATGGV